mgnify:CR=1 FL=1
MKHMLYAIFGGVAITFVGLLLSANVDFISGSFAEKAIFMLLLYLLLVVSIFGILILTKLSNISRECGGHIIEPKKPKE